MNDRDQIHASRFEAIDKRIDAGEEVYTSDLFVSERVIDTILEPKALLPSLSIESVIAQMPYYETIYVTICPACVTEENFDKLKILVSRGSIIPALIAPYHMYDDSVSDFIYGHDHLNSYEYYNFRFRQLMSLGNGGVCLHCVGKWEAEANKLISRSRHLKPFKGRVDSLVENLNPFISPDIELMEDFKEALRSKSPDQIDFISDMSEAVHALRTAQAFNSSITLGNNRLSSIPTGITAEVDEAIVASHRSVEMVANGLGLKIPSDIDLNRYIDLVETYRPTITSQVNSIVDRAGGDHTLIQKEIMKLNGDIERVSKSRRYMLLETAIEFYGKNSSLVNATLMAGAFGLAGGLAGCVGGPAASGAVGAAASGAASFINKKKWISGGDAASKLSEKIGADIQPFLSKIVAMYAGSSTPAINIMSLRNNLNRT
jgi:hypothetical protein